jgi:hypothetical protein
MNLICDKTSIFGDNTENSVSKPAICMQIFRHNFDNTIMNELTSFAKLHEHDSRPDFKEAWKLWVVHNQQMIDSETERLLLSGFTGNVLDKMYKSVRYYFRKKSLLPAVQPIRKTYIALPKPLLATIDEQIQIEIRANIIARKTDTISTISPAEAFHSFCSGYQPIITNAIRTFYRESNKTDTNNTPGGITNLVSREHVTAFMEKLKKTYKNRFYNIRVRMQ